MMMERSGYTCTTRVVPERTMSNMSRSVPEDRLSACRRKKTLRDRRLARPPLLFIVALVFMFLTSTATAHKSFAQTPKSIRGGAIKISKKRRSSSVSPPTSSSSALSESTGDDLPTVQAILVPRKVNLLRVVQTCSLGLLLVSFAYCLLTAGEPFVQSVWTELYGAAAVMPAEYKPSQWDLMLSRHATLPPPFLPSPKPLVTMLMASILYVSLGLLFPRWFASSYRVALKYRRVDQIDASVIKRLNKGDNTLAALVKVPQETRVYTENKALLLCALQSELRRSKSSRHYFDLCSQRYYYDDQNATVVSGAPTLQHEPVTSLVNQKGLTTKRRLQQAHDEFDAYNRIQLPSPTVLQAFWARLASPLVVLQLFGKVLAALEDPSFTHTLFSTGMTLVHHYWNARNSIVSARELSKEVHEQEASMVQVKVKRSKKKWTTINAADLLPGDIFELASEDHIVMPIDAVILKGGAVANEAVLTGETVAQSKVALDGSDATTLDMMGRHRSSVLFAGSTILHSPQPITCVALRTGSYSSRGDLLRALQKSRVGAVSNQQTERDGLRLMASLGVVACASCTWFWTTTKEDVSVFKKILQCSRILLAAIPSDLPMVLSAIAHTCAQRLRRDADVVCSEPGLLLTAATVNHVLFDKTGTLTADTQSLSQIMTLEGTEADDRLEFVLAGCHSLVKLLQGELVGDPLDLASLRYSNWKANKNGSFKKDGMTVWQIKIFPFDANRRTSSSLILVRDEQKELKLYKVIKGSPDAIQSAVSVDEGKFAGAVSFLGQQGYRVIATGVQDITDDSDLINQLFQCNLADVSPTKKTIKKAQGIAQELLHRDEFEAQGFDFSGFLCFEAAVRPSTPRIINELQQAQMGITMLTGDGVDAAVSVAKRCQIISDSTDVVLLDWNDSELSWRRLAEESNSKSLSTRSIFARKKRFACVATGRAIQALLEKAGLTAEEKLLKSRLKDFDVFASASPNQKVLVATALKNCGEKVLMCGDGVNDVAAMKIADCGVALLNGFGDQSTGDRDLEDERRRELVQEKRIGSNRKRRRKANPKLGKSGRANRARVKELMNEALLEVKKKAAKRQGISNPNDKRVKLSIEEAKESWTAVSMINRAEGERRKLLRKGGAGAAKILAEEDKKLTGELGDLTTDEDIKPGEASLVSPFSCLRPAIDGVEAILRQSAAAASFMQVMHQTVALGCLQSAFYLATLYKGGFRYGKYMWNVELVLYMITEQAANMAACTPRPRLSTVRPPESFFNPFSIMSILSQFYIHASTRMVGVRLANRLEAAYVGSEEKTRMIKVGHRLLEAAEKKPMDFLLKESLVKAPVEVPEEQPGPAILKLFRRAPFKPNYTTNVVFLLSIMQPAVSTLANHRGRPFHGAVLEHRMLIVGIGLSILFSLSMLAEGVKPVNEFLQLRLLPSTRAQMCLFTVFLLDAVGCWIVGTVCKLGSGETVVESSSPPTTSGNETAVSAADQEEKILAEEAEENGSLVKIMVSATTMIFLSSLAKTLEAQA